MRGLFDGLAELVRAVGPVRMQAYTDHVAFLVRVRFLGATPRKRWLDVALWLPYRVEDVRLRKIETPTPVDHIHLLRLTAMEQVDAQLRAWIQAAYAVGEQREMR